MVMEAMRLSLLEHEEQQRKERDAEAKKKQNTSEGSPVLSNQPEGAGPSSSSPPYDDHPLTTASSFDGRSEVPPYIRQSPAAGSSRHDSNPSLSGTLAADQQHYAGRSSRRASPSPTPSQYSIRAALASAASTAGAVISPGRSEREGGLEGPSDNDFGDTAPRENENDGDDLPLPLTNSNSNSLLPPPLVTLTPEIGTTEDITIPGAPQSSASSVAPEIGSYEPLASSPSSTVSLSQKPLLGDPSPITPIVSAGSVNGDPSDTHAL